MSRFGCYVYSVSSNSEFVGNSVRVAAGEDLAIALALPDEWLGTTLAFTVTLARHGIILETHPPHQPIRLAVPGPDFDAKHWRV